MKVSIFVVLLAVLLGVSHGVSVRRCRMAGRAATRQLVMTEFAGLECDLDAALSFVTDQVCTTDRACRGATAEMCMNRVERRLRRVLSSRLCGSTSPPTANPGTPTGTPMASTPLPMVCDSSNPIVASINFGSNEVPGFDQYDPTRLSTMVNEFGPRGGPDLPAIYRTHIWNDGDFRYFVPMLPTGTYYYILYFSEIVTRLCSPLERVFAVKVSMNPVMNGLDVFSGSGCMAPYTVEGTATTTRPGLALRFLQRNANNPFVSGVQVFEC